MQGDRIGMRLSSALRAQVQTLGEESATVRALLILGLHTAGVDIAPFAADASAALARVTDPQVQAALLGALFNKRSTDVQQTFNTAQIALEPVGTSQNHLGDDITTTDDPLAGIGIEV